MKKRLYRSKDDAIIAGVCGGLGEFFEVDSTLIRIIFVILAIWGGIGVIFYLIFMLFMSYPEKSQTKSEESGSTKQRPIASEFQRRAVSVGDHGGGQILGLIILFIGIIFLLKNLFPWFQFNLYWPLLLIVVGIVIIASGSRKGKIK